jgi:hypothetical protein
MNILSKEEVKRILRVGTPSEITEALKEYFKLNHSGYATVKAPSNYENALSLFNVPLSESSQS